MNHFRLPFTKDPKAATTEYGNVATLTLIRMMVNDGSDMKHLEAQVFGGAYNSEISPKDIGGENAAVAKKCCCGRKSGLSLKISAGKRDAKLFLTRQRMNKDSLPILHSLMKRDRFIPVLTRFATGRPC